MSETEIDLEGMSDSEIESLFVTANSLHDPSRPPVPLGQDDSDDIEIQYDEPETVSGPPEFTEPGNMSFFQRFRNRKDPGFAGLDTSAPNAKTVVMDPSDPFLSLLQPLPASEISMLSAEVSADDTVFQKLERARVAQYRRYSLASFLGAFCVIIFALTVGTEYVTETLINPAVPSFAEGLPKEPVKATLFAFGILAPLMCGFVIADGMKSLLNLVSTLRLSEILVCVPAALISLIVFASCRSGQIAHAVGWLIVYLVITSIVKRIGGLRG